MLQQLENCTIDSEEITQIKNELYLGRMLFLSKVAVLQKVSEQLANGSIPHVFLKGAVLSQYLYGNPYQRQSNDIDIYVPPTFVWKSIEALEKIGFKPLAKLNKRQLDFFQKYRWELSLYSAENNVILEIHWNLSYTTLPKRLTHWAQPNLEIGDIQHVEVNGFNLPFLANHLLLPFQIINGCSNYWARYDIILEFNQLKNKIGATEYNDILFQKSLTDFSEMIISRYLEFNNLTLEEFSEPFQSQVKSIESGDERKLKQLMKFWQRFLTKTEFKTFDLRNYVYPNIDDVKRFKILPSFSFLFLAGRKFLHFTGLFKPIYSLFKPILRTRLKKIGLKD